MKLNTKRTVLVGMAFFLISAFWQAYNAIVPLILTNHFGLSQFASGAVMSFDNILAVFMLPLFGAISDKVCTKKFGRRTPFILVGTIAAVIAFVFLAFVDAVQFKALAEAGIHDRYVDAQTLLTEANDALKIAKNSGNAVDVDKAKNLVESAHATIDGIRADAYALTMSNIGSIISFVGVLLVVLVSMATFRSPAVALMPDVTVKPLRSKANAIINLTGTAGGILVLGLGIIFKTSRLSMQYVGYVIAVVAIMLVGLIIFMFTVKEKRWSREMEEETARLGLEEASSQGEEKEKRKLSRGELHSLLLILASVALWYIGYDSITSKYSVYAVNVLGFDFNATLIVAQAAAIISYIPVGILASKIGRKKTILIGISLLASAFFIGNFITSNTPEVVMYPVFGLAGIGWATINVNSFPMVVELARGGDVGKYTGYYYTASMAAQIVAPILSGLLYVLFDIRYVFFAFGTVFVALSFVTMFFVKHGDAKPIKKESVLENLDVED